MTNQQFIQNSIISDMSEGVMVIRFDGVKYEDYVIFDLSKSKTVRYDDHTAKMAEAKRRKEAA